MKTFGERSRNYIDEMAERKKKGHIYRDYQLIGLEIAQILEDAPHKALYIKLVKQHGKDLVIRLAKTVSETRDVKNKGAYFMRLLQGATKKTL